jgi:hypothetical protein
VPVARVGIQMMIRPLVRGAALAMLHVDGVGSAVRHSGSCRAVAS